MSSHYFKEGAMNSFISYLESLSKREKIVKKDTKVMNQGEQWTYPVRLEEGTNYTFKIKGRNNTDVSCSLNNGNSERPIHEAKGSKLTFSFVPEKTAEYKMTLSSSMPAGATNHGKIVVVLAKEYLPKSILNAMYR
jgi:hypothetical protein